MLRRVGLAVVLVLSVTNAASSQVGTPAAPTALTLDARPCVYDTPSAVYDSGCVLQ
jgi:hypothetical protein